MSYPGSENQTPETSPAPETRSTLEPVGLFLWDLSKVVVLAMLLIIPIRLFVFQPFVVSGSSMEPNFNNGDYLIIDEISYRLKTPERGDVVVLRYPKDPTQFFIKRLIGLPGETVVISGGKVTIQASRQTDGETLQEEYLSTGVTTVGTQTISLGPNEYFVLGDNRAASSDSRVWGILPGDDIVGKAWVRVLPISEFSIVNQPKYNAP